MKERIKRLRVFAGPNGSGKTTLYNYLLRINAFNSYYHINPDIIQKDLSVSLNLGNWPFKFSHAELSEFLSYSPFNALSDSKLDDFIICHENNVSLKDTSLPVNTYLSAAIANFLRKKMLLSNSSFSFESVFSHNSKIEELEFAKKNGFLIYFYYISTSDPVINLQRIKNRAECGGHDAPEDKIVSRYKKTMDNLYNAFKLADKVYFFDNSKGKANDSFDLLAEKTGDKLFISDIDVLPRWFNDYIINNT